MDPESEALQLKNRAASVLERLKTIRSEAGLLPLFSSRKRPISAIESSEEEDSAVHERVKKQRTEHLQEIDDNTESERKQLMERLATYSTIFHSLSRPLSALEFACYGWKDTHKVSTTDKRICILECIDCGKQTFVIDIDSKHKEKPEALEIERKYRAGLISCHNEDCIWRHKRIDELLYRFPLRTITDGTKRLATEGKLILTACQKNQEQIPTLLHALSDQTLNKVKYVAAFYNNNDEFENDNASNCAAYILALYGWKPLHDEIPGVRCDLCFTKKAFYHLKDKPLDVLNEHKIYCPWRNAVTANTITPKDISTSKATNQRINGAQWMVDAVSIEYLWLIKKADFTVEAKIRLDDKYQTLRNKIKAAKYLVKYMEETVSNAKKLT